MKSYQIFVSLIIFINFAPFTLELDERTVKKSEVFQISMKKDEAQILNFTNDNGGVYHLLLLSLNNKTNITIQEKLVKDFDVSEGNPIQINLTTSGDNAVDDYIKFSVAEDAIVEVTSVLVNNITNDTYVYQKVEYLIDTELSVEKNNFVIILDKDEDYEQFDMKFKFNDTSKDILDKYITYGFILLPSNSTQLIAQGKYYTTFNPNLTVRYINHTEFEEKIPNPYYKNAISKKNDLKPYFAFIFSIDSENKIDNYSFAINSEIINVFLIVSIVIALVFAIITFFLIRRKQSSESTNIEGDNLLKGNEKEENENKGETQEQENKEENEEQAAEN
jgi:hypothetical protein